MPMGHGILYCATCHQQLRDTDFDKGAAYRLEGQAFCEGCARDLIHTLPEDRVNAILRTFESSHDDSAQLPPPISEQHGNRTTRILTALSASPSVRILSSSSRRIATVKSVEAQSSSLIVSIGIAVVVLVMLAIIGVSSDSGSPKHLPAKSSQRR